MVFFLCQIPPLSRRQIPKPKISDADANQSQRRMADGGGHAAHLPVFAFDQFQPNPAIRYAFTETNRRVARRNFNNRSSGRQSALTAWIMEPTHVGCYDR